MAPITSFAPIGPLHTVVLVSCKQDDCLTLQVVHHGSYCTHNLEAFPTVHQIACASCDGEGLCMKDNNVFAQREVASNLDGPHDDRKSQ